jgi:hypothetical protein
MLTAGAAPFDSEMAPISKVTYPSKAGHRFNARQQRVDRCMAPGTSNQGERRHKVTQY